MSHISPRRRWWRRRRTNLDPIPDRSAVDRIIRYRARPYSEWTGEERRRQRGAVLVEAALIMPVVITLLLGTVSVGLVVVAQIQLEHAVAQAADGTAAGILHEDDVDRLLESVEADLACLYAGAGTECFDDGLSVDRVQITGTATVTLPGPWWESQTITARSTSLVMP